MGKIDIEQRDKFMEDLLCAVSQTIPCEYLSDLTLLPIRDAALYRLAEFYREGAPWPYCAYALSYITGDYDRFDTQESMLQYLKGICCGRSEKKISSERRGKSVGEDQIL